jgi:hypothetical protein
MRHRVLASIGSLTLGVAVFSLSTSRFEGQGLTPQPTKAVAAKGSTLRTPWGDPDLQGIWNHSLTTPFERPAALAGKGF